MITAQEAVALSQSFAERQIAELVESISRGIKLRATEGHWTYNVINSCPFLTDAVLVLMDNGFTAERTAEGFKISW